MCFFFLKQVLKITESLIKLQFQCLIKFYQKLCKEAGGLINDISKFKSPPFKNRIKRFLENFVEKKSKNHQNTSQVLMLLKKNGEKHHSNSLSWFEYQVVYNNMYTIQEENFKLIFLFQFQFSLI